MRLKKERPRFYYSMTGWTDRNRPSSDCIWPLHRNAQMLREVKHWTCQTMPDQFRSCRHALPFCLALPFWSFLLGHVFQPFVQLSQWFSWLGSPDQLRTHEGAGTHFPAEQGPGHNVVLPKTPHFCHTDVFFERKLTKNWNVYNISNQQNQEQIVRCSEDTFPFSVVFNWVSRWHS